MRDFDGNLYDDVHAEAMHDYYNESHEYREPDYYPDYPDSYYDPFVELEHNLMFMIDRIKRIGEEQPAPLYSFHPAYDPDDLPF